MKKLKFDFLLATALWIISCLPGYARQNYEETKQVNKTYTVTSSTAISFTNSFGRMHVNTWDKNQVQVSIEIITRSGNESRAKELLDGIRIDIDDANPSTGISFKTVIPEGRTSGNNTSMEINYSVNVPKNNPLYLRNSFGDCYLGDYAGKTTIRVSYGNLNTGNLEGSNDIDLSFGGGTSKIDGMKSGELKISYSSMDIGPMGQVDINSQFSNLEADKWEAGTLVAKYGQVSFGEIGSIQATVNFSPFRIDKLDRRLNLDIQYGGQTEIRNISNDLQSLDIESSFGPVRLDLPPELNAALTVHVEFGNFNYDKGNIDFNRINEGNTSKDYEGKIGKGSTTVAISVTAKYGDVRINQD